MKKILILGFLLAMQNLFGQTTALQLVEQSIAYHDPENNWDNLKAKVYIESMVVREGDTTTSTRILHMNLGENYFMMKQDTLVYEYPCENCERARMFNNYFRYLLGLPMKLKDPGTIIQDEISLVEYKGMNYQVVKVTYDPEVGTDTWKFYFDPTSSELMIAEFSKDGTFESGETIELNNKIKFQKMILPGQLKWLVLPNREFLAEEDIKYAKLVK